MKRVLVTGASGFVGAALCHRLLQENIKVHGVVRNPTKAIKNTIPVCIPDMTKPFEWTPYLKNIDTVYHLAAQAHGVEAGKYKKDQADFSYLTQINVRATKHLINAAQNSGVHRFVYVSSIKVNGEQTQPNQAFSSQTSPAPEDDYGRSKYQAEKIIWSNSAMESVVVRPPLVYGPKVKGNFFSLLKLCASGLPLPLKSIDNKRSFIFINNLTDFLYQCGVHFNAPGQTFLVSDGQDLSTPELISSLRQFMNIPPRLIRAPLSLVTAVAFLAGRSTAIKRLTTSLQIDCADLKQLLGWFPPTNVQDGLYETVQWFKENHS